MQSSRAHPVLANCDGLSSNSDLISLPFSQGDGHSFVTRLVHIDPEQANSVLQQNGKRCVHLISLQSNSDVFRQFCAVKLSL